MKCSAPMASRATDVYHEHPETYDAETKQLLDSGESPLKRWHHSASVG